MIPEAIVKNLRELDELVTRYPLSIPTERAAEFLHTDCESLKAAIEQGKCPFAYSWQKNIKGYRQFKIPSATFYLWYTTGGAIPQAYNRRTP